MGFVQIEIHYRYEEWQGKMDVSPRNTLCHFFIGQEIKNLEGKKKKVLLTHSKLCSVLKS